MLRSSLIKGMGRALQRTRAIAAHMKSTLAGADVRADVLRVLLQANICISW